MSERKKPWRIKPLRPDTINARLERPCRMALEAYARNQGVSLSEAVNLLLLKALPPLKDFD
jgi:hypothetical protein